MSAQFNMNMNVYLHSICTNPPLMTALSIKTSTVWGATHRDEHPLVAKHVT